MKLKRNCQSSSERDWKVWLISLQVPQDYCNTDPEVKNQTGTNGLVNAHLISWPRISIYMMFSIVNGTSYTSFTHLVKYMYINQFPGQRLK